MINEIIRIKNKAAAIDCGMTTLSLALLSLINTWINKWTLHLLPEGSRSYSPCRMWDMSLVYRLVSRWPVHGWFAWTRVLRQPWSSMQCESDALICPPARRRTFAVSFGRWWSFLKKRLHLCVDMLMKPSILIPSPPSLYIHECSVISLSRVINHLHHQCLDPNGGLFLMLLRRLLIAKPPCKMPVRYFV